MKRHVTLPENIGMAEQIVAVAVSFRCVRFWCGGVVSVSARPKANRRSWRAFCFLWLAPFPCRLKLRADPDLVLSAVIHHGRSLVIQ